MKACSGIRLSSVVLLCVFAPRVLGATPVSSGEANSYDIVVAGAGTGGVSAAIQAARLGARVALLEETDWVGGQMGAAAVSTMDEGTNLTPPSGLYGEFVSRMDAYYAHVGKAVGTCYWHETSHCYEPSVIRRVLTEMVSEAGRDGGSRPHGKIDLLLQDRVQRVLAQGKVVTGVVTASGRTLNSKVLIDATEYGDVLPLTPARYRSGRSTGPDSHNACAQDLTYVMVIRRYASGVPKDLQMKNAPPEYDRWLPQLEAQWQIDGNPKTRNLPVNFANHNAYRGLPDSSTRDTYVSTQYDRITRTELNWFNDYPTTTNIYNRERRKAILCEAKLKTMANLYYLQHELGETLWSVANDEGFDTPFNRTQNSCPNIPAEFKAIEANMPPAPYIRESNRLVGEYTLTAADLRRDRQGSLSNFGFTDAIAVGDYADDLHGCTAQEDFDPEIENIANRPPGFRSGPFEVPLRSLIPEEVEGLLAAEKNISETRLANGATRLQPITMLTGQAAGGLAALAVKQGLTPRTVPAEQVQRVLLLEGSILARQPMPDLAQRTALWQAAQYAVTHRWMGVLAQGFAPNVVLTRAQGAEVLSRALLQDASSPLRYEEDDIEKHLALGREESTLRPSYTDVPLYNAASAAVEALHARALVSSCKRSASLFCPDEPMSVSDFMQAVKTVYAQRHRGKQIDATTLLQGANERPSAHLTRGYAALILFNAGL